MAVSWFSWLSGEPRVCPITDWTICADVQILIRDALKRRGVKFDVSKFHVNIVLGEPNRVWFTYSGHEGQAYFTEEDRSMCLNSFSAVRLQDAAKIVSDQALADVCAVRMQRLRRGLHRLRKPHFCVQ